MSTDVEQSDIEWFDPSQPATLTSIKRSILIRIKHHRAKIEQHKQTIIDHIDFSTIASEAQESINIRLGKIEEAEQILELFTRQE